MIAPILTVIVLVLVGALFIYLHIALSRLETKTTALQTQISTDANKISAIVNFLNSNSNAANKTVQ